MANSYSACIFGAVCIILFVTSHFADARSILKTNHRHKHSEKLNATVSPTLSACEPPDEPAEERKRNNEQLFHPNTVTYGIQTFDTSNELPPSTQQPADSKCGYDGGSGAERQSSCTWSYQENYDPLRIPQTLLVAVCDKDCTFCMDSSGTQQPDFMSCQEVKYNMRVLRRPPSDSCVDGMFKYEMVVERIAVACSCQLIQWVSSLIQLEDHSQDHCNCLKTHNGFMDMKKKWWPWWRRTKKRERETNPNWAYKLLNYLFRIFS